MRVLVTGTAGFIGHALAQRLLADGHEVFGVDGFTPYYDVQLKRDRHARLQKHNGFSAYEVMLEDQPGLAAVAEAARPQAIVHLAAYVGANLVGTFNILELARQAAVGHLLLASTSSAYGANTDMPFRETDKADLPITLYAATKKSTELMSHAYSHLWRIPTTAFRFFTVYGPWGRPDMAPFKFADAILNGRPIEIFNHGDMSRDFTYIDDLVEALARLLERPPVQGESVGAIDTLSPVAPWRLVNIGGGAPTNLMDFIEAMEGALGRQALRTYLPMQPGDVPATFADASLLEALTGYRPATPLSEGVEQFCRWFEARYGKS